MSDWTRRNFIGALGVTGMVVPLQFSHEIDEAGVALIRDWITSLPENN